MKRPKSIDEFLTDYPLPNVWIKQWPVNAYVRKGRRYIDGEVRNCLDIASVDVTESRRGKGVFTKWLTEAEATAARHGLDGVYLESVLEPRLCPFYEARGYTRVGPEGSLSVNYYRAA